MEATLTKTNGEVTLSKPFDLLCSLLRNGVYTLKITRKTTKRSLPQNKLMWMWYKCIEDSTGTPANDIHEYYKSKFLCHPKTIYGRQYIVVGSTTNLNTTQFTEYLNKIQADAATELGIRLPLPDDQGYDQFVDMYNNNATY